MTKYWLHRITGGENAIEFAHPLLFTHNYLSIGWSDFSDEAFLENIQEHGVEGLDEEMQNRDYGLPKTRWNLWRFIKELKKGDIVVVPTWGEFSIFEIIDDVVFTNESMDGNVYQDWNGKIATLHDGYYYTYDDRIIDLGFYRKVKPLLINIPRDGYADQELFSRMKIRQTNADISDLAESIEYARKAFEENNPINLKEQIVEETAPKLLALIERWTTDIKFEDLVEWYLRSLGARIEKPSKNESATEQGDADRVGYFDNIKTAIMVQVKKHEGTTDEWAVQQIKAYKTNHNYGDYHTQMWVISTCKEYSEKAKNEAVEADVRLIDGLEFAKMILDSGLEGLSL
jgi:predicted Mrr-cat superfamily restriction endonuclease